MRFNVDVEIKSAQGFQTFQIEADCKEEAYEKYCCGEGEIINNEIEVTNLEDPALEDFYED